MVNLTELVKFKTVFHLRNFFDLELFKCKRVFSLNFFRFTILQLILGQYNFILLSTYYIIERHIRSSVHDHVPVAGVGGAAARRRG